MVLPEVEPSVGVPTVRSSQDPPPSPRPVPENIRAIFTRIESASVARMKGVTFMVQERLTYEQLKTGIGLDPPGIIGICFETSPPSPIYAPGFGGTPPYVPGFFGNQEEIAKEVDDAVYFLNEGSAYEL